jgi:hypothetical protein
MALQMASTLPIGVNLYNDILQGRGTFVRCQQIGLIYKIFALDKWYPLGHFSSLSYG